MTRLNRRTEPWVPCNQFQCSIFFFFCQINYFFLVFAMCDPVHDVETNSPLTAKERLEMFYMI